MSAVLRLGRLPDGIAFSVLGRGTFTQSRTLDQMARAFTAQCPQGRIVIDLTQCAYLDSTFLGCLVTHCRKTPADQQASGRLSIFVTEEARQRLFGSNHLDRFLPLELGSIQPVDGWEELADGTGDQRQMGEHVLQSHRCLGALNIPHAEAFRSIADRVAEELSKR